ncbi:H-NS family nucleoid-associated regulatory protein [Acidovorax sp.]|uniref:H-NS histone family protein n=1 Tax=Acidovorax sp. TaxID=1872122 RepID=UPI00391FBD5F
MASYKDLLNQRDALEAQIGEARKRELSDAVSQVRSLIAEFGLTQADIFSGGKRKSSTAGTSVAAKYRDPATGSTWTGRGKPPLWIRDKDRSAFEIK